MRWTVVSAKVTKVDMLRLWDASQQNVKGIPGSQPRPILIDTSFKIDVGETVVVGTSRLAGEQALILLVTAVPR